MQELRQQCSERSPVVAIGKNAGVKMGNHLVRKRDLGLRPLAGAQRDVATCYFGVGALARGHGSDDVDLFVSRAPAACATLMRCGLPISSPDAQPMRSVGVALLATEQSHPTARKRRTIADARGAKPFCRA